jgi:hypothetical protein
MERFEKQSRAQEMEDRAREDGENGGMDVYLSTPFV